MLIYPQTITQKSHSDILEQVDKKLVKLSSCLRNSIRFGSGVNINYDSVNTLLVLRDVYISKVNNATWLCGFSMNQIVSSINKELRKL